jgi:predicted RNase H-related nuclease YkuK (DUF458 family)
MSEIMQENFLANDGRVLNKRAVVKEIHDYMHLKPHSSYKIIVGSDSQPLSAQNADFVTAIVVHRVGNGGRYFWRRMSNAKVFNLRDRILKEVMLSLETSVDILKILKENIDIKFDFEVHVDVGPNGKTSELISEVTGIIRAYDFPFKTKPESYAASSVADKHV